jgi:ferredoxin
MKIDPDKCVACGNCVPICPMGAISIEPTIGGATINADEYVECFTCYRGMSKEHLNPHGRAVRQSPNSSVSGSSLSRISAPPMRSFRKNSPGRESCAVLFRCAGAARVHGHPWPWTTEVKTNDVTQRVKEGEAGFVVEFGRQGRRSFREISTTTALAQLGVEFEE